MGGKREKWIKGKREAEIGKGNMKWREGGQEGRRGRLKVSVHI